MAHFLVSYDLHKRREYQPLWRQLNTWGAKKILESLWGVDLTGTAQQVRDILVKLLDDDDSVVVIELPRGIGWATTHAKPEGTGWLRSVSP